MRATLIAAAVLAGLCLPGRAEAQITFCPIPAVVVSAGQGVDVPAGRTQLSLVTQAGAAAGTFARTVAGTWVPAAADVSEIGAAQTAAAGTPLFFRWSGPAGVAPCDQSFALTAGGPPSPPPAPPTTPTAPVPPTAPAAPTSPESPLPLSGGGGAESKNWSQGACARAGGEWQQELRRKNGNGRFTEIVFLENRSVCFRNRDYGVTGDPIFVGVFTSHAEAWDTATIEFDPCALEPASPTILASDKASVLSGFQSGGWKLRTYPERACFNGSVVVTLKTSIGPADVTARTTVDQSTRYRATAQLGVMFTTLHDQTFGLRPDSTGNRIFSQGPEESGPEYYAAVVLYSLPRYLPALFGRRYSGRDPVHDNSFVDRLGGVLGVGIKDPGSRFVTGLSFEVIPGIDVTGTWNFAKVTRLAGVKVGDPFSGSATSIPTREVWQDRFAWGVSLDLRYVSALVTR
jgi:hypothetical protein